MKLLGGCKSAVLAKNHSNTKNVSFNIKSDKNWLEVNWVINRLWLIFELATINNRFGN